MANINEPLQTQQIQNGQAVDPNWYLFFASMRNWITQNSKSGTTAQRPTTNLYNFRFYGDKTLGIPIWYFDGDWIDAAGNIV